MKLSLSLCLTAGVAALSAVGAETNDTRTVLGSSRISAEQLDRSIRFQHQVVSRLFGVRVQYGGAIPLARQAGSPWQIINPFSPLEMGDGTGNLSVHPTTGRAEGLVLFAVKF